jgi:hypothetical protein
MLISMKEVSIMKRTLIILFTVFAMMFAGSALADQTTNTGVAVPGIGQGQGQGQTQAINGPLSVDNSVVYGSDLARGRGFAIPGEMIFPGTPGYYGEATPGHRFIPLNKLLMFTTVWDAKKAENMLKTRTGNKDVQIRDLFASVETAPADKVFCTIVKPQELGATAVEQVSIGTVAATNRKSISADVLATAIVAAGERGANYIMFMAEGVNREVDAQGFGIGLNYTKATLNGSDNDSSGVASGGLGYSRGWAGYIDYPWLQFTFLRVEGLQNLPEVAAIEDAPAKDSASLADVMNNWLAERPATAPVNTAVVPQTSVRINPAD